MELKGPLIRFRSLLNIPKSLTIKALIATTADNTLKYFLIILREYKA